MEHPVQQGSDVTTRKHTAERTYATGFWSRILPRGSLPCPRSLHAGAVYGTSLYIFGGYDGQQRCNDLHRYNFQTNCWTVLEVPVITPSRRDRHSAVIYGHLFIVFGGFDGRFRVNDIHAFDLDQNTWQEIDGPLYGVRVLPTPRHSHSAVVYGTNMFIFGGYDGSYCGDFHQFSFINRTWNVVTAVGGEAPSPRYRSTCIVRGDNMILHGGHDGNRHLNDTFVFNFTSQIWSLLLTEGLPPSPRDSHVAVLMKSSMFIFGGSTGGALGDLHDLDLDTLTWSPVTSFLPTTNLLKNNMASASGGKSDTGGRWVNEMAVVNSRRSSNNINTTVPGQGPGHGLIPASTQGQGLPVDTLTTALNELNVNTHPPTAPIPLHPHVNTPIQGSLPQAQPSAAGNIHNTSIIQQQQQQQQQQHQTGPQPTHTPINHNLPPNTPFNVNHASNPHNINTIHPNQDHNHHHQNPPVGPGNTGGHTSLLPPPTFAAAGQGQAQGPGLLLPPGFPLSDNNHNHNNNNHNHNHNNNNNNSHHMLYDPNNGNVNVGMVPIANPGCRFCHIAVMYEGSMYTFGGYDGSHRLNDFLKFTFINELPTPEIPSSSLVVDLKHFVNNDMHSDIVFVVEGHKVPAHKILLIRCPYFHNMLSGEFMESRAAEVAIEDVKHDTFLLFLEYLYSDHVEFASADIAMDVFQVADRFGVERLKKICEGELVASIKIDNAAQILLAADAFNAERLRERCLNFLVTHFDDVSKTPCFEEMARVNLDLLFEVLRLR